MADLQARSPKKMKPTVTALIGIMGGWVLRTDIARSHYLFDRLFLQKREHIGVINHNIYEILNDLQHYYKIISIISRGKKTCSFLFLFKCHKEASLHLTIYIFSVADVLEVATRVFATQLRLRPVGLQPGVVASPVFGARRHAAGGCIAHVCESSFRLYSSSPTPPGRLSPCCCC